MWFADVPFWLVFPKPVPLQVVIPKPAPKIPEALCKVMQVPRHDQGSEIAALHHVATVLGYSFRHSGPDYALWDTGVTFGAPIAVGKFLNEVGDVSFLPTQIQVNLPSREIVVANLKPLQGPIPKTVRYVVVSRSARVWTFKDKAVVK